MKSLSDQRWSAKRWLLAATLVTAAIAAPWAWIHQRAATEMPTLGAPPLSPPSDPAVLECPSPSQLDDLPKRASGPGPFVPIGAVAARMCLDRPRPASDWRGTFAPEQQILVKNVDQVIAEINALPAYRPSQTCTHEGGEALNIVFGYPAGQRVVVWLQNGACYLVRSGQNVRSGGQDVSVLFVRLLEEQQAMGR